MGTPTIDRQVLEAAVKRALSAKPFITAVAEEVANALAPEQNSIVLPPPCSATLRHWHSLLDTFTQSDDGAGFRVYFLRVFHGNAAGFWTLNESRLDGEGGEWSRCRRNMVIDDFGSLVEGRMQ